MPQSDNRYASVGQDVYETEDGSRAIYLRRRFLPMASEVPSTRTFEAMEFRARIDLVAALALGNAFLAWAVCDANDAMNPFDLVSECAGRLRIPLETNA